jgi:hypothetical protein
MAKEKRTGRIQADGGGAYKRIKVTEVTRFIILTSVMNELIKLQPFPRRKLAMLSFYITSSHIYII